MSLYSLGFIHYAMGELAEATRFYERARAITRKPNDKFDPQLLANLGQNIAARFATIPRRCACWTPPST